MARKSFNFIVTALSVTIQKLAYADPDADATVAEERSFAVADIPSELLNGESQTSLAAYGLSQVLQDRCSSVPTEDKFEQMEKTFATLVDGKWKEARVSTTGGVKKPTIDPFFASGFSLFLQSKGKAVDANTATLLLQNMDAEQRKALRNHDEVKVHVDAAKEAATTAAGDLDLDSLLS